MILRGILDNSLNGQLCLRGFAPIKELARISKADYTYQRNPIEGRTDIQDFLETQSYLFFPEVILSYKIKHSFDGRKSTITPLQQIRNKSYISNVEDMRVNVKKVAMSKNDVRVSDDIVVVEIILNDQLIDETKPFHRIDGNHRLMAAENSITSKVGNMVAPFCIILGQEFYSGNVAQYHPDTVDFEKANKVFFHNINTRTIPLTSEQNLKVIIDDNDNFTEEELEDIFQNKSGAYVRETIKKIGDFTNLKSIFIFLNNEPRNILKTLFDYLQNSTDVLGENLVDKVVDALLSVNEIYRKDKKLNMNRSIGVFITVLYYNVINKTKCESFITWLKDNHLSEVDNIKATSLIKIFNKIYEKKIYKIFVAMPYYSHSEITEYNKLYKEICSEISKKVNIELELIPIMRFRGKSQRIDQRLLDMIKSCDIFIADITGNNINVIFEVGYAESTGIPMILLKNESDDTIVPFDMDKLQYLPYQNKGYYNDIKNKVRNNLKGILEKDFKITTINV